MYNKGFKAGLNFRQIYPYIDINYFIDQYKKNRYMNQYNKGFIEGIKQSKF